MINKTTLYCLFITTVLFYSCKSSNRITFKPWTNNSCIELLREYKHYWIDDSLGKNGFRELLGVKFLKNCSFKGERWSVIYKYFGKPNFTTVRDSFTRYRYRLNNFTDDLGAPGNMFLEIFVQNDIITIYKVDMIDG